MAQPTCGAFGVRATGGFFGPRIRSRIRSDVDHTLIYLGDGRVAACAPHAGHVYTRRLKPGEADDYEWSTLPLDDEQRGRIIQGAHDAANRKRPWSTALALAAWADVTGHHHCRDALTVCARGDGATCATLTAELYLRAGVGICRHKPFWLVHPGDLHHIIDGRR